MALLMYGTLVEWCWGGGSHCHAFHTWIGLRMKPGLRSKTLFGCLRQLYKDNFMKYGGGYCIISCHGLFEPTSIMIGPLAINSQTFRQKNTKTLQQSLARCESIDSSWVFLFTWYISREKLKGGKDYFKTLSRRKKKIFMCVNLHRMFRYV